MIETYMLLSRHSSNKEIPKTEFYSLTKRAYSDQNTVMNYAMRLHPQRRKPIQEVICRFISLLPPNASIVDLGCGTGKDVAWFRKNGFRAIGLDNSEEMLKIAKKFVGDYFIKCDIRQLEKTQKKYFDGIFSLAAIQHIHRTDLVSVLQQIRLLLRPNGFFCLITKEGEDEYLDNRLNKSPRPTSLFSISEINASLLQAGFTPFQCKSFTLEREGKIDNWLSIQSINGLYWQNIGAELTKCST